MLIEAVIQAMSTCAMSVIKLPKRLCNELSALIAKFWWVHMNHDIKIQWKKLNKVGIEKSEGGMEFRDIKSFNQAMLAKPFWRLLINPNSLIAKIMMEKYYKQSDILKAKLGGCPSHNIWRSI